MATEDYKSDSNCDLLLSCNSSPFGSVDFLIQIKTHRLTHTCMNQSSPVCVLYLSDASNNEEKGRMKKRKFWWPYTFFLFHKIFSTLTKTKINHFSDNYIFYQQRLSNFLYTKVEKLLFGKGWIWHAPINFYQASIKALRLPPYHSAIPQSKEHRSTPSSILIKINMTHIFLFKFKNMI